MSNWYVNEDYRLRKFAKDEPIREFAKELFEQFIKTKGNTPSSPDEFLSMYYKFYKYVNTWLASENQLTRRGEMDELKMRRQARKVKLASLYKTGDKDIQLGLDQEEDVRRLLRRLVRQDGSPQKDVLDYVIQIIKMINLEGSYASTLKYHFQILYPMIAELLPQEVEGAKDFIPEITIIQEEKNPPSEK